MVQSCPSYNVSADIGQCSWGVTFVLLITCEGRRRKSESAYSEEQQAMDLKSQKVKLNDGHFIPVLGFGTAAPEEVRVVVVG